MLNAHFETVDFQNPTAEKFVALFGMNEFEISKIRNLSEPTEKFTDWDRFQIIPSD
jgi:hypothetical protein